MGKRIDYRFRALIPVGSMDEILVKYLRSKDLELSEKNLVLWAVAAYWLPLALQKDGCCSNAQLKQSARTAIYKLRQHINFLAHTFGLEAELETTAIRGISPKPEPIEDESVHNRAVELLDLKDTQPPAAQLETSQLLYHSDDKTFEALFVQ